MQYCGQGTVMSFILVSLFVTAHFYTKKKKILSDTTVRRSAVDQENLKPYWKSEKRPHYSMY